MTISKNANITANASRRQFLSAAGAAAIALPFIRRSGAAGLEKIRMASWSPRLAEQANIYVSEEKGFFKEQGLDMEWIPGQGSGDALKKAHSALMMRAAVTNMIIAFHTARAAKR